MTDLLKRAEDPTAIAAGLTKALRSALLWLARKESLLVPKQLSWRRSYMLQARGVCSVYPFHQRWLGRADITPLGLAVAQALKEMER